MSEKHPAAQIDVDATLVNVHSDKEGAAPTFKKGFGYHPLTAWIVQGQVTNNWKQALAQLAAAYPDRINPYL